MMNQKYRVKICNTGDSTKGDQVMMERIHNKDRIMQKQNKSRILQVFKKKSIPIIIFVQMALNFNLKDITKTNEMRKDKDFRLTK